MPNPNPERSELCTSTAISKPVSEEEGALQTPGDALGARHPMNKPNSWSPQLEHGQDQSVRATWDKIDQGVATGAGDIDATNDGAVPTSANVQEQVQSLQRREKLTQGVATDKSQQTGGGAVPKSNNVIWAPLWARHPINKPNSSPDRHRCVQVEDPRVVKAKKAVPTPKRTWYEHLTGYVGWWRQIEKEASKKTPTGLAQI